MKRLLCVAWPWWRRAAQAAALVAFLWLFRRTESTGADVLPGGENLFFRIDPLAGAAAMLAGRCLIWAFWPVLIMLGLTLVFGRFFCGWVCPLGTLFDVFQRAVRPLAKHTGRWARGETGAGVLRKVRPARYVLMLLCLVAALFAFPLVGFADPFALLMRGLTFGADPWFFQGADAVLTWAGQNSADPVRRFFVRYLLPFRANNYDLTGVSAVLLALLFALELVTRRFWCRYLCPLGALYGLVGRLSLIRRLPVRVCKNCGACASNCRMGALDALSAESGTAAGLSPESCNVCMDCVESCPRGMVRFALCHGHVPLRAREDHDAGSQQPKEAARGTLADARGSPTAPLDLSRRGFLAAGVTGAAVPLLAHGARLVAGRPDDPTLLRPPGAGDEKRFLNLCVRCGLCMKVCPTNVLQPAILQAGVEGMFSPRLAYRFIFEQSYCEYNCNLCGQVCPSGAIPRLALEEKHKAPMGKAWFDHSLCLPWAKQTSCIRCEEVCPLPEKAITIQNVFNARDEQGLEIEIQQPRVDRDLCTGCGICESNCPLEGEAGIRVQRTEASDPCTEFLGIGPPPPPAKETR